jgi:hypothetical protein
MALRISVVGLVVGFIPAMARESGSTSCHLRFTSPIGIVWAGKTLSL